MAFNIQNFVRSSAGEYSNSQVQADYKYNGLATDTKAAIIAADFFLDVYSQLVVGSMLTFTANDADLTLAYVTASSSTTVTLAEITETLPPGSVDTADIADLAVTTAKIALANIDSTLMADDAVSGDVIADLGVDAGKYAAASIATADIALLAIDSTLMADDAISGDVIADLGVTAGKYAAGSIASADLASGLAPLNNQLHTTAGGSSTESITIAGVVATDVAQVTLNTEGATPVTIDTVAASAGVVNVVCSADPSTDHVFNVTVFRP